jgi:predicted ABC-type transport system involved in lysophospholipase L1 biosynthesis ATPase subunit
MSHADPAARSDSASSHSADARVALGYEPPEDRGDGRIWIPKGGSHRVADLSDARKARLLTAVLDLKPELGARLVLLGLEVDGQGPAERAALRARVAFLPADGGLLSNLNAWENIVLPLGFHTPGRLRGVAREVSDLLKELGADPHTLLPKLPERMSVFEKKLTGYVRILLESPELVLVEDLRGGLDAAERAATAGFPPTYLARCPGGTLVELEGSPEA